VKTLLVWIQEKHLLQAGLQSIANTSTNNAVMQVKLHNCNC
jgi:hypothetical protein